MTDSENVTIDPADSTDTAQTAQATSTDETTAADAETAGTATTTTEDTTMSQTAEASATTATRQVATGEELVDVETLGKDLPGWKLAGLMRHQRWASGKAVTQAAFDAALAAFEGRPLGGGR